MRYTAEQFIEDVKKEARALREHATKEELARLNLASFSRTDPMRCIYGQMTGDCTDHRATELMSQCCPLYFENLGCDYYEEKGVAGVLTTQTVGNGGLNLRPGNRFSAIETYVMTPEAKNVNLISYLKGETDTLDL